jgi:flagellar hook-associated protein 3 FlgL
VQVALQRSAAPADTALKTRRTALGNFFRPALHPVGFRMRITNNVISRNALLSLQRTLRQVDDAQHRATTGLRVEKASDDPSASTSIMGAASSLRAIDQYKRNVSSANARLSSEEGVLNSLSTMLERAKELGVGQGSATADAQTRLVTKTEVDQIIQATISLGNTQHEGEYLFGGDQSNVPPFQGSTPPFAATPPTGTRRAEISSALFVKTNHNGSEVFLDSGVLTALTQLSTALGANDQQGVLDSLSALDAAHANVQVVVGETGSQMAQLDVSSANLDALDNSLRAFKSDLQDADLEKAVTDLVSRQTAYQSALLATSRVMGLNLADYLR